MDLKQTSGEGSVAEEANPTHGNEQGSAADASGSGSRTQAPRVSADAFLALLDRLDGKAKKGEADHRVNTHTVHAENMPSSDSAQSSHDQQGSAHTASQSFAAVAANNVPPSTSASEHPFPTGTSDPASGEFRADAGKNVSSAGARDDAPAQPAAFAETHQTVPANELGSEVSELDVAFASAMVQGAEHSIAPQSSEVPFTQGAGFDPGGDPSSAPADSTAAASMNAGMTMPGTIGMPDQPSVMPETPALGQAQAPAMPDSMPPSPTPHPLGTDGMTPPVADGPFCEGQFQPQNARPSTEPVGVVTATKEAEEESADVLAARLLAIMAMPDSHAQPSERALATDGLILKLPELSSEARRLVAERFCLMERPSEALTSAVLALVSDDLRQEVLENARFSTWRLLKLVASLDDAERRMIARRRHLPTVVSEALIETGDATCLLELVRNAHARIDEHGFHTLVDLTAQQPDLQAPLATRGDLPPAVGFRLFRHVPPRLRRHLVSRFLSDSQLLDRVFSLILQDPPPATAEQVSRIESMIDTVAAGDTKTAADLLSRLLDLHKKAAAWIVADRWGEPLVVVLKVLGYARSTFPQAMGRIINSPASPVENGRELAELQALFDSLSFNKARLLLLYWDWEARRTGPYALLSEAVSVPTNADVDAAATAADDTHAPSAEIPCEAEEGKADGNEAAAQDTSVTATGVKAEENKATFASGKECKPEAKPSARVDANASADDQAHVIAEAGPATDHPDTDVAVADMNNLAHSDTAVPASEASNMDTASRQADMEAPGTSAPPHRADATTQMPDMAQCPSSMQSQAPGMAISCAPAQPSSQPAAAPCMPAQAPCVPGMASAPMNEAALTAPSPMEGASQQTLQPGPAPGNIGGQATMPQSASDSGHALFPSEVTQPLPTAPGGPVQQSAENLQTPVTGSEQMKPSVPVEGNGLQTAESMAQPSMSVPGLSTAQADAAMAEAQSMMMAVPQSVHAGVAPQMPQTPNPGPSHMPSQASAGMNSPISSAPDMPMGHSEQPFGSMGAAMPGMSPTPPQVNDLSENGPVTFGKRKTP